MMSTASQLITLFFSSKPPFLSLKLLLRSMMSSICMSELVDDNLMLSLQKMDVSENNFVRRQGSDDSK